MLVFLLYIISIFTTYIAPCPVYRADLDHDGTVTVADVNLAGAWFLKPAPAGYDQDGDGIITTIDLAKIGALVGKNLTNCLP